LALSTLRSTGNASVVWIADTATLGRIGEVQLASPSFFLAPTPDGRALIATTNNIQDGGQFGTRLVEVPSGRTLAVWPGTVHAFAVLNSTR
jgi:hypothetical protein